MLLYFLHHPFWKYWNDVWWKWDGVWLWYTPFICGVSKCLPIRNLEIGHVCSLSFTVIPSHRELFCVGNDWGMRAMAPWSLEGRSHLPHPLHFNPQLHPSIVMWQWQNIPRILSDCCGVWHLSLAMKWNVGNMLFRCCRFPNSKPPD